MLNEESALSNTEEVGYTSPVKSVYETMIEGDYEGVSSYIPDFENPNSEIFRYQEPKSSRNMRSCGRRSRQSKHGNL